MKRLVIVSGNKNGYSETFVRNHIRYLPAEVHHLYGGTKPTFAPNDEPLMLPEKWADKFFIGTNRRTKQRLNEGIKIYLKTHKIDAVLAEFGPTGVEMMSLCKALKIPLIVHFHGFDAHNKDIVKAYKVAYKKMFKIAAALVVVSADMRRQLLRLGAPDAKVYHLTLGVDIKLFHPSNKVVTTPNFVSVGRFVPKKAFKTVGNCVGTASKHLFYSTFCYSRVGRCRGYANLGYGGRRVRTARGSFSSCGYPDDCRARKNGSFI